MAKYRKIVKRIYLSLGNPHKQYMSKICQTPSLETHSQQRFSGGVTKIVREVTRIVKSELRSWYNYLRLKTSLNYLI